MSEAPRRPRRLGLIIPFAIFFALAAGWTIYWYALKHEASRRVEAFLAEQRAAGAEAQAKIARGWGFPLELAFELEDVVYAPRDRAWRASSERIRLNVNPVNPSHVILEAPSPIAIAWRSGREATLTGQNLWASVRMRGAALARAGVEGTQIAYVDPDPNGRGFTLARGVADARPDPRKAGSYQASVEVQSLGLARPVRVFEAFGETIERAQAFIVVDKGDSLFVVGRRDPFETWREAGGVARVESARVQWGPATIESTGDVALDTQHRLTGRLDLTFAEPARAIRALSQSPSLPRDARRALELFALGAALSGDDLDTNVEARDGWLSLGGIRVRTVDPVY